MVPPKDFTGYRSPTEVTLEIKPRSRFELIDVNERVCEEIDDFGQFPKAAYCSLHTTAGYLEQNLSRRLKDNPESVSSFMGLFHNLFPPEADYRHDQLHLRDELSDAQKLVEPRNADSHLTFIGSGLENCVIYKNKPDRPVYFVELDGINGNDARNRRTSVIGFNRETLVEKLTVEIPTSSHPMDSINLRDEKLGFFDQVQEIVDYYGIEKGRIDVALKWNEANAGLTVNEYETLLMRHDLVEVLRNPMRYMARRGYNMLKDPRAIPNKAKNYAKYDLVQIVNEFLDKAGLSESLVERLVDKMLSVPASRFLRMKRSTRLLISEDSETGKGRIVQGTYQSPILVQWRKAERQARKVEVSFVRFE
ncbi:MAG: hypothetical protein HKN43_08065 [Rhodothermales bacterium]|nr:hypothetical protein [Rhodothermales bacterium]